MPWFVIVTCRAVFWASVAFLAYTYVGYPLIMFVLSSLVQVKRDLEFILARRERRQRDEATELPAVTLGFAAYNEQDVIDAKLRNILELDYPAEKLEVIVVSDGSTDETDAIVERYAGRGVRLLTDGERRGKAARINQVVAEASHPIVVLSDANTMYEPDALRSLVRHFEDERVGSVCGEVRLIGPDGSLESESLYWRYEVMLKFMENKLDLVLGSNGPIYAVRKDLYEPIPDETIVDDFVIPMAIRSKGYRLVYDPEAVAHEQTTGSIKGEFVRRRRIGAGNWQAAVMLRSMLNPFAGRVAFSFWSHKIFRWTGPLAMITAFGSHLVLAMEPGYTILLVAHVAFYAAAAFGHFVGGKGTFASICRVPQVFVGMNLGLLCGFLRFLTDRQAVAWEQTRGDAAETPADESAQPGEPADEAPTPADDDAADAKPRAELSAPLKQTDDEPDTKELDHLGLFDDDKKGG